MVKLTASSSDLPPLDRVQLRRGGRSERVRNAVMAAVRQVIIEEGYGALSHRRVAALAKVDAATVYRRWPTKARLAADLFLGLANDLVPVPDTGELLKDLEKFLRRVVDFLSRPEINRLIRAVIATSSDDDPAVAQVVAAVWSERFAKAFSMLDNAVARGDLRGEIDQQAIIEALVAPAWFRLFVSKAPADKVFIRATARLACLAARN